LNDLINYRREDPKKSDNRLLWCDLNFTYSVDLSLKDLSQVGIGELLNRKGFGILAHPFPLRPWIMQNHSLSHAGASLLSPDPCQHRDPDRDLFPKIKRKEMKRVVDVIIRRDGYFQEPFAKTKDPIFIKFPKEYGKRGVQVPPELNIELPQRVIPAEPQPYVCTVDGASSDGDETTSLEFSVNY